MRITYIPVHFNNYRKYNLGNSVVGEISFRLLAINDSFILICFEASERVVKSLKLLLLFLDLAYELLL